MNEKWNEIYNSLRCATRPPLHSGSPTLADAESRYKTALDHWQQVKQKASKSGFSEPQEEINFFSAVKPRFTGLLEFYTLLYQYRLFCPEARSGTGFHQHEVAKVARFRDLHTGFLDLYRHGRKEPQWMSYYFLRRNFDPGNRDYARPFDANPDWFTNGDWQIAQLIGNLHYGRFLWNEHLTLAK